jgi:hypothetical protein
MIPRILTVILAVGLSGAGQLAAQEQQKQQPNDRPNAQQQQTDTSNRQSAQSFQGKITRAGNQLVFQDASTQTAYQLDDQSKVAPFEGKSVKMMATVDSKTNSLHVIDVSPAEK